MTIAIIGLFIINILLIVILAYIIFRFTQIIVEITKINKANSLTEYQEEPIVNTNLSEDFYEDIHTLSDRELEEIAKQNDFTTK